MSTRGTVAVLLPNGRVRSVYVHFDSYLVGVGKTLLMHWNSFELAKKLTSLGSISILGERLEPIGEHSFKNPEIGTCVIYGRDRGDKKYTKPFTYSSIEMYRYEGNFQEYNYIFAEGEWMVSLPNESKIYWQTLKEFFDKEI